MRKFDNEDLVGFLTFILWALLFGLLAWGAWEGVVSEVWWGRPLGWASGFAALRILVTLIRITWRGY